MQGLHKSITSSLVSPIIIVFPIKLFNSKNKNLENRKKALYSPLKNQIKNKKVKNFIKMRSSIISYTKVFVT